MKILFTLCFSVALLFQSCSNYVRVVTFRANAPEMDSSALLYANDSFSIQYDFYGDGPIMRMRIFNKLDIPLAINWAQSSYIIGSQSISYINTPGWQRCEGYDRSSQVSSVPPHSFLQKAVYVSIPVNFVTLPLKNTYKHKLMTPANTGNDSFKISEADYILTNTPFNFRNYLSLSYDASFNKMFHLDQNFWVASVKEMSSNYFFGTYVDDAGNEKFTNPFVNPTCFFIIYKPNQ